MIKKIRDYYSDWEGWYCEVEDKNGNSCGEVIENTTKELQRHLKDKHKIIVELE
jgi:hypothetical protein